MKTARLLPVLALTCAMGCERSELGKGATENSKRHEGVEEPPSWEPERSPATVPTRGEASGSGAVDQPGQVATPKGAAATGSGATSAPARDTAPTGERQAEGSPTGKLAPHAKATFQAAPGVKLKGRAELEEKDEGVRIEVEVADAPRGPKGIHIHEKPDCTNIPEKSMGGHFAPDDTPHGLPENETRHLGDLGNIQINRDGDGKLEIDVAGANLKEGDSHSLLGRAIVIHEKKDQGRSAQPSGSSGTPIACAVIKP